VIALTADSIGSCDGSRRSRSITTEVSSNPRGRRRSATRYRVLRRNVIEVGAELLAVDGWCVAEHGYDHVGGNEAVAAHRSQFSDRGAIARDDEGFPMIKTSHDLTAVVAQLSLRNGLGHPDNCSTLCYRPHPTLPAWSVQVLTLAVRAEQTDELDCTLVGTEPVGGERAELHGLARFDDEILIAEQQPHPAL